MTPLSLQLKATAKVVAFVMSGRSLNDVLADGSVIKPDMRSGVQALSFAVLRNYGMARALRTLLAPREPAPPVDALLCTALALLISASDSGVSYTEFTLVDQAVDAAKAHSKTRSSASFINAALRRFLRERIGLTQQAVRDDEALYNHPQWWIDKLRAQHIDGWQAILHANQMKPRLTLRVNITKTSVDEYVDLLTAQDTACETMPQEANAHDASKGGAEIILKNAVAVASLPYYTQGWLSVQDAAAQGAAKQLLSEEFLAVLVGRAKQGHKIRVLDACAAPGGKTTHLIELLLQAFSLEGLWSGDVAEWGKHFEVTAVEFDSKRAQRIHENLSRLKLRATVKVADASRLADWWDGVPFDAVLLDAPCTASGIVRRHPDVRWLRRATDVERLTTVQFKLLSTLWQTVAVGGRLLYATCSVFEEEGQGMARRFIAHTQAEGQPLAKWLDSHGLWLPCALHDGFYDALFEKRS